MNKHTCEECFFYDYYGACDRKRHEFEKHDPHDEACDDFIPVPKEAPRVTKTVRKIQK